MIKHVAGVGGGMLNKTSFIHATTLLNILRGCREAMKNGVAYVNNRHGHAYLTIRPAVNKFTGYLGFNIRDANGVNVAEAVLQGALSMSMLRDTDKEDGLPTHYFILTRVFLPYELSYTCRA